MKMILKNNATQIGTQTGEDSNDVAVQTDEIEMEDHWCMAGSGHVKDSGTGNDKIKNTHLEEVIQDNIINSSRFLKFVRGSTNVSSIKKKAENL